MAVVREMVDNKEIKLEWITKDYQLANMLTKKGASNELLIEVLINGKITWLNKSKNVNKQCCILNGMEDC